MNEICGKTIQQIRKAYFSRKLPELLNEIQTKENSEEEIQKLEEYLDLLKTEQLEKYKKFSRFIGSDEILPPSADELIEKVNQEKIDLWLKQVEEDVLTVRTIMTKMKQKVKEGKDIKFTEWLNSALEIVTFMYSFDKERVYRDQMYRKRLTEILDTYQISRAEAEERAKLTKEYRDYKTSTLFRENLEEYIMLAKKYYSPNQ